MMATLEPGDQVIIMKAPASQARLVGKSGKIIKGMNERPGKVWVQMDTSVRELPVSFAAEDVKLQFSVFAQEQMRIEQRQAQREAERERKREEAARKGRPPPDDESVSVFRRDMERGHRGWILKKGGLNTQFQRRYFEVLDGKLSWYESEASHALRKPSGWVACHGMQSAADGQDADGRYLFAITPEKGSTTRRIELAAETKHDRDWWLHALNAEARACKAGLENAEQSAAVADTHKYAKIGWLLKKGQINPAYQKRFFALDPEQGVLSWYATDLMASDGFLPQNDQKGWVALRGLHIDVGASPIGGPYLFFIEAREGTTVRRIQLAAEYKAERDVWVKVLSSHTGGGLRQPPQNQEKMTAACNPSTDSHLGGAKSASGQPIYRPLASQAGERERLSLRADPAITLQALATSDNSAVQSQAQAVHQLLALTSSQRAARARRERLEQQLFDDIKAHEAFETLARQDAGYQEMLAKRRASDAAAVAAAGRRLSAESHASSEGRRKRTSHSPSSQRRRSSCEPSRDSEAAAAASSQRRRSTYNDHMAEIFLGPAVATGRRSTYNDHASSEGRRKRTSQSEPWSERTGVTVALHKAAWQQFDLFQSLDPADIAHCVARMKVQEFRAGDKIVRRGLAGSSIFFIDEGCVRAEVRGHALPDVLTSGNHFGEISFVASCKGYLRDSHAPASRRHSEGEAPEDSIRVADVVAMTPCRVLELKADDFVSVLQSHSTKANREILAALVDKSNEHKQNVKHLEQRERDPNKSFLVARKPATAGQGQDTRTAYRNSRRASAPDMRSYSPSPEAYAVPETIRARRATVPDISDAATLSVGVGVQVVGLETEAARHLNGARARVLRKQGKRFLIEVEDADGTRVVVKPENL